MSSDAGGPPSQEIAAQPTLHVELSAVDVPIPVPAISSGPFVAVEPTQWPQHSDELPAVPPAPETATLACAGLVTDPRNAQFLATLLVRPPGRWSAVLELCQTSGVAVSPLLPPPPLFVTWLEHPYLDPSMCAVVFLSLREGWSTSFLCARRRW